MKRVILFIILAVITGTIGCKQKKIPKEDLFFIVDEDIPYNKTRFLPYEINIEFLKKKKIKSYILYRSWKDSTDFIFSFYNSIDSPVVYTESGWVEKFYYHSNSIDSIIYYHDNDSGQLTLFDIEYYKYKDNRLDSIVYNRRKYLSKYSYKKDIMICENQHYITRVDTFFYKEGRVQKMVEWNSKKAEIREGCTYQYKNNQLIKIAWLYGTGSYDLDYDSHDNLVSVRISSTWVSEFKYDSAGVLIEMSITQSNMTRPYKAKIEYQ